uniref:Gamma-aminobutyric acid type A receptor subunit alpha 4 n=1 Tax=Mus musculus TaxID=10090 RepID=A0A0G2JF83_MOUSE
MVSVQKFKRIPRTELKGREIVPGKFYPYSGQFAGWL